MFLHTNETVANTQRWESLSPAQKEVVAKCLAKDPNDRFSSVVALTEDLRRILIDAEPDLEGTPICVQQKTAADPAQLPTGRKYRLSQRTITAALAMIFAIIGGAAFLLHTNSHDKAQPVLEISPSDALARMLVQMRRTGTHVDQTNADTMLSLVEQCSKDRNASIPEDELIEAYYELCCYLAGAGQYSKTRSVAKEALQRCYSVSESHACHR